MLKRVEVVVPLAGGHRLRGRLRARALFEGGLGHRAHRLGVGRLLRLPPLVGDIGGGRRRGVRERSGGEGGAKDGECQQAGEAHAHLNETPSESLRTP